MSFTQIGFFGIFGVFLLVFLGVWLVRSGIKGAAAQREMLKSASPAELESMRAAQRGLFMKIGPPLFTLVGGIVLVVGIFSIVRANASESWPMVEGEVIRTDIVSNRKSGGGSSTYRAKVEYQYAIDGVTRYGARVSYAGNVSSSNRGSAMAIIDRYPKGSDVTVYYDPADPEESVLEPGISAKIFLTPAIGGVFLVLGLALLFSSLKGRSKHLELEPFE